MRTTRTTMTATHPVLGPAAILAAALFAAAPAFAQDDGDGHGHAIKSGGRGDRHSPSWDDVMKLKGEPKSPNFPKVGEGIERHVLDNGLVVYLAEDRSLPIVRVELLFRGGDYYEPAAEQGVASFTGSEMRNGGTERMTPDELDDHLAFLAANLSSSIGDETGNVSLDVLSDDLDEGLAHFSDVVLRPRFDSERFELSKRRRAFQIQHRNDNPGQIARREFDKLLFGESHPRGRELKLERLDEIRRDDLVRAHGKYIRPNNSTLVAVGDFAPGEMLERIRTALGTWQKGEALPPLKAAADLTPKPGVFLIDRKVNQSNILIGHIGINRDNPDRFAVALMNDVLGGGSFSSRITERVRSDEGLAYSASSRFDVSGREIGTFTASVQTKTESTARAVSLILDEVRKIRETGSLSRNEFDTARESTLFSYVFRFENRFGNVARLARYEMDGRPADTDRVEFEGYGKVAPEAIEAAAKAYLRPDALTILVVGDKTEIGDTLAAFGPVKTIELEDEAPAPRRGGGPPGGGRGGNERP